MSHTRNLKLISMRDRPITIFKSPVFCTEAHKRPLEQLSITGPSYSIEDPQNLEQKIVMPEKINFCWQYDKAHQYDLSNVRIIEEIRVNQARSFF